jgi:hypothetical protein
VGDGKGEKPIEKDEKAKSRLKTAKQLIKQYINL